MRRTPLFPLIATIAAGALAAACSTSSSREAADAGPAATRGFDLAGFDKVSLKGSDDVSVTVGPQFSVTATGPQAMLDRLDIRVEDGVLVVARKKGGGDGESWSIRWKDDWYRGVKVAVTMPALTGAVLAGSGDMQIEGARAEKLDLALRGSGDLRISGIDADALDAALAGSGDMVLAGSARQVALSLAGSGDIDAGGLNGGTLAANLAGSGDIRARASGEADVSIVGSGDITIAGTSDCRISKLGSGEVTCTG